MWSSVCIIDKYLSVPQRGKWTAMKKIYLMVVLMVLFTFPKGLTPFKRNSNGCWRRMLDIDLTEQKWCIDPRDRQKNRGGMARVFRWRQSNFKRWEPWPYTLRRGCQFRKMNCHCIPTRSPAMFCPTMGGWLYWKIVRIATTSDRWCYRTRIFWFGTSRSFEMIKPGNMTAGAVQKNRATG